jgi:hypothetical protein
MWKDDRATIVFIWAHRAQKSIFGTKDFQAFIFRFQRLSLSVFRQLKLWKKQSQKTILISEISEPFLSLCLAGKIVLTNYQSKWKNGVITQICWLQQPDWMLLIW